MKMFIFILFLSTAFLIFSLTIQFRTKKEFVEIKEADYGVVFDIRYATEDNFTKKKIYKTPAVYLSEPAAKNLRIASEYAKKLGYKIKIFDAFRPLDVQQKLYDEIKDERYVSDPKHGVASHTRGVAIDLTLIDLKSGKDLDMGTEFDSFEEKAHHNSYTPITHEQLKNRTILAGIMAIAGFTPMPTEWWHYNLRLYEVYPEYGWRLSKKTARNVNLQGKY